MTINEFNDKYKDYLEEGHYGLDIDDALIIGVLDELFQDLTQIKGFKYYQIKLKFGQTRFYTSLGTHISGAIEDYLNHLLTIKTK